MRPSRKRPRLGQHFLANPRVREHILDVLGAKAGEHVVEIGPGRGALTLPLLSRGVRVLAVELDARLAAELSELVLAAGLSGLTVRNIDALDADFDSEFRALGLGPVGPLPLVANLPYESATAMLRSFVRQKAAFSRLVVMVQREVAVRITASPGEPAYGFLSLDIQAHAAARLLFEVPPRDFTPPPRVMSTVLELVPREPGEGTAEALRLASLGFRHRRKTLVNALSPLIPREAALEALEREGLDARVRAERLDLQTFRSLARRLPDLSRQRGAEGLDGQEDC